MLMGKVYSVPNVAVPIMHSFSSEGELAKANKRNAELLKLAESRNKVMSMGGDATQIQNRIKEILDEQMLEMEAMAAADPMLQGQEDPAALPPGQAPNPQNAEPPQGQGEI